MSEAKEEGAGKKKGGKLPIILALVLMLGGGGFFMTKKGGHKEKPKTKLAKEEIMLEDEYIVNMADGRTYVRAKIGLRAKEGFKGEEVAAHNAEVSDAIIGLLKGTSPEQLVKETDIRKLKIEIAKRLNKIFAESEKDKEEESDDSDSKKKKKKDSEDEESSSKKSKKKDEEDTTDEEEIPEGWDSAKGPILKVFFKALATQ